jgi:hypothetical protein
MVDARVRHLESALKSPPVEEQRHHPSTLVRAFLASATLEFGPLTGARGTHWSVRVEHSTSLGLEEVEPENITGFFFATATFAGSRVAGEITFGDREYVVNTVLGPVSNSERYGLWEWADALGRSSLVPRDTGFVTDVERMRAIVVAMAAAVRELEGAIAAASPAVVERIESARALVQERFRARLHEDDHRRASAAAAEAFRARDFRRVVTVLEAVKDMLTPAEREKLAYAKRHLQVDSRSP